MNDKTVQQDITAVLADVASAVVGHFEEQALLDQIIATTMQTLHAEVCSIFLEDKENEPGVLKCVAGSGFASGIVGAAEYKIGEGFTGSVAEFGGEYNIRSRQELENLEIGGKKVWKGDFDYVQWPSGESEFRNLIALPLSIKGQALGVIKVENKIKKYGNFFTNEDLVNFKTIANVISLALENAKLHQKAEEQSKRVPAILADVASAVVGHFDMETLLNQIINTTMKILHAEVCSIFLEDKENEPGVLKCVAGSGFASSIVGVAEYKIGEGLTGSVAESGEGYNSKSREEHEHLRIDGKKVWRGKFDPLQWPSGESEFRNGIALPLKMKGQTFGVIKAENKSESYGDFFTDEDLVNFKTIANVISLTLENARLHLKDEEQSRRVSAALADVASAVVGHFDMETLLNQIINTTMKILHAEVCSIFLEDKENEPGVLKCVAGSGFASGIVGAAEYKIGEGFTGSVAEFGGEYNIRSRQELENLEIGGKKVWKGDFDYVQWPSGESEFRNLLALPLKIKEQTFGVIKVENKEDGDFFSGEDETIFRIIANVIALTIEKTRLQLQIEDQLKTMSLMTGHKVNNLITRYDGIDKKLTKFTKSSTIRKADLLGVLEELRLATVHTKRMVEEFQEYGQPIHLDKQSTDINQIIKDEVWLTKPPSGIRIETDFDPNIPEIEVDAVRFPESIKELLKNAIKVIKRSKETGEIYVTTRFMCNEQVQAKTILIRIEDNGPGFPADLPVFEPFQTTDPEGTGLGLATVKKNLEAHGGTIKLLEKAGMGACFELTLPIHGGKL